MKKIIKTVIIATFITTSISSFAESSESKREDIKKLIIITEVGPILGTQVINQILPPLIKQMDTDLPVALWADFMEELDFDKLVELCIPIYEKHFTHDEIKELLKFYETPLGKKMISAQGYLTQECMLAGLVVWGQEIETKAIKKIQKYNEANK